jgi:hypothetical protein
MVDQTGLMKHPSGYDVYSFYGYQNSHDQLGEGLGRRDKTGKFPLKFSTKLYFPKSPLFLLFKRFQHYCL